MENRINIGNYPKLDYKEIILNYDLRLMQVFESVRGYIDALELDNELEYRNAEKIFLQKNLEYLSKRFIVFHKYLKHCKETGKNIEHLEDLINKEIYEHNYKTQFIWYKSRHLGFKNDLILFHQNTKLNEDNQSIDLSDTKGTEKIIMLYKMGILDFLKKQEPFNASTNLLASAISGITGVPQSTVQSYINPIDNPATEQNKNPLTSAKTVNKVIQKLTNIGYIPIK